VAKPHTLGGQGSLFINKPAEQEQRRQPHNQPAKQPEKTQKNTPAAKTVSKPFSQYNTNPNLFQ